MRQLLILAAVLAATPAAAQTAPAQTIPAPAPAPVASEGLKARIAELPAVLSGKGDYEAYFSPEFRAQVPKEKFDQVTAQFAVAGGPVTGIESVTPTSPDSASIVIGFENGTAPARISVDPAGTHQVQGLLVTGFTAREASIEAVRDAFGALPGKSGFILARLGDGAPELLSAREADTPFAVGSAFKLAILAELVRETNAGTRKWTDMVMISGAELPGGAYTGAVAGAQFTLKEIASKMISVSDNSATDILLKLIGRERVEALLPTLGVKDPARNRPYLATLDMFKLKGVPGLAPRYLAKDEAGRRAMLDGEVSTTPLSAMDPALYQDHKPILINELEWYFSPADLVRIMDWLCRNTASGPGAEAREILAINSGITKPTAANWRYVGYKGGSEPGVLNMTLLLQSQAGAWYVLSASTNDTAEDVNLARFAGLINRAAELAAKQ
jgi:beta-lactamase class A